MKACFVSSALPPHRPPCTICRLLPPARPALRRDPADGWHLGEHGEWDKHTNFDLNTHAPVMFRVPGLTDGGVRTSEVSETVDIFPSLVDFAMGEDAYKALPVCDSMWDSGSVDTCVEGTSLRPLVAAPRTPVKRAAFSAYNRGYIKPSRGLAAGASSGSTPSDSPCLNTGAHKTGCTMGYTMLTKLDGHEVRYTEWVRFAGPGAGGGAPGVSVVRPR